MFMSNNARSLFCYRLRTVIQTIEYLPVLISEVIFYMKFPLTDFGTLSI